MMIRNVSLRSLKFGAILAACFLLLTFVGGAYLYGSFSLFYQALGGAAYHLSPATAELGTVNSGVNCTTTIKITNLHFTEPLRINGSNSSCGCTLANNLPIDIAPRDSKEIEITVLPEAGEFGAHITFYTSDPQIQPVVTVHGIARDIEK